MASLIPGYVYDIFISYRQKDNKYDGWITEFVDNLKKELEATFKEEINVYFDISPHDGLLETHDVNASLKDKLKCLVFIPIISRTYCDSKSFAWVHEFSAFVEKASKDQYGLKVKLPNGNVANRVLPVRIHDLDAADIKECESVLGGVLRGIEFIYKEAGIDKPLAPDDDEKKNLNGTKYRIQIIKVAHAVKEIILGLKTEISEPLKEVTPLNKYSKEATKMTSEEMQVKLEISPKRKLLLRVTSIIIFLLLAVFVLTKVIQPGKKKVSKDPDGRISIAVTIFDNNTNDTTLNWLTKGIPELIRNNLTGSEELSVQNSQTMYELYESMVQSQNASIAPSLSREAAIKLKTRTYITGSFQKFGEKILTYIKLIDTKNDELLWTGSIEGDLDNYKYLADSLSVRLKEFLEIKAIKQKSNQEFIDVDTDSPEALKKYVEGMQLMMNGNLRSATPYFEESYRLDTSFTLAALYASYSYSYLRDFVSSKKWTKIAYKGKERLSLDYKIWIETWRACNILKDADSTQYYCDLLLQSQIKSRLFWWDIGYDYLVLEQYQKAVRAFENLEMVSLEWGGDWKYLEYYVDYGFSCHKIGLHEKEKAIYEIGLKLFPDNIAIIYNQAVCALSTNDTLNAKLFSNKLLKIADAQKWSRSYIELGYGNLYAAAGILDMAEMHYWNALRLDSNNYSLINTLALFLVKNDRDIEEAEKLVKRSLQINPDTYSALHVYGLVLYKQRNYEESLKILEQAYAKIQVWNGPLFKEIKNVKMAIANQK